MSRVARLLRTFALPLGALTLLVGAVLPPDPGPLVIIGGGGGRPDYVKQKTVELAGGASCRMVVIPMASADPLDAALYQAWQLEEAGYPDVDFVRFDSVTANHDSIVLALDEATGIFFSGTDADVNLSGHGLKLHLLKSGQRYYLERRRVPP